MPDKSYPELQVESLAQIEKLRGLREELHPVAANLPKRGKTPVTQAWFEHLEYLGSQYRQTKNSAATARGLLKHHCVMDFRHSPGTLAGRVYHGDTFRASVTFQPFPEDQLNAFRRVAGRRLGPDAIGTLRAGRWPEGAQDLFADPLDGLMPGDTQVRTTCECYTGGFCPHALALVYAAIHRIDTQQPLLWFEMFDLDPLEVLPDPVDAVEQALAETGPNPGADAFTADTAGLDNDTVEAIFGADLDLELD